MKSLILALIVALTAFSAVPATAAKKDITISAKNFAFVPAMIVLKLNQKVELRFVSKQGLHGIVIPEIGINSVVNIGSKPTEVEVTPKKLGTFTARCAVFCGAGHANMILKVKVVK